MVSQNYTGERENQKFLKSFKNSGVTQTELKGRADNLGLVMSC